ncbi:DUF4422 domain-containing protein [Flavobacterium soyangense]|uniref:DUF4422 domain-containing protein n=1 Tax=Flavobacterium soyangense TaxID=2023265 RepID=A0A930UDS3_9FLAO|nr:DUF4422 domain-containing protein [Flavobacterium soyangense]MBF2708899.1 DUF4422 domain-containing protein [Flavobacterium soyangense]
MVKIFVVTHKENPILSNELLIPIQVGNNDTIYPSILRDNILENIANKNSNYCELSATYWIWKNIKDAEYIGICHYRRYFNFYNPLYNLSPSAQKKINTADFKKSKTFHSDAEKTQNKITSVLKKYDIILGRPYKFKDLTITQNYCADHREEDWYLVKKIISEKYPEYKESILKYLDEGRLFHMGNMMICSKEKFDAYQTWLFSILFELESKIDTPKDQYQARVFGFISERLINLYVYHNNFKIKGIPSYKIIDL